MPSEDSAQQGVLSSVIGHDGAKAILRSALRRGDIHILLEGPPASGKSVALLAIEQHVPGANYAEAKGYSEVEMRDTLAEDHPILMLDEVDAAENDAYNALPIAMEQGRVTKNKATENYDVDISTQVIAACNDADELPTHVEDRFRTVRFSEYSYEEFEDVCAELLPKEVEWVVEGDTARGIAEAVYSSIGSKSPRDARDAAKLAGDESRVESIARALQDPDAEVESDPLTPEELQHRDTSMNKSKTELTSKDQWVEESCEHMSESSTLAYKSGRFLCPDCASEYGCSPDTPLSEAAG